MKKLKISISILVIMIGLFILLHATPNMALRTHVLFMGYPKAALTSDITEYAFQNMKLEEEHSEGYAFTEPPIEQATQGILETYLVKKVGFLYFAEFRNDL